MQPLAQNFWRFCLVYGFRNLSRNRRRSFLTVSTVALSVYVSIVGIQFADASMQLWKDGTIEYGAAHAQFRAKAGWKTFQSLERDHFVQLTPALRESLRNDPDILGMSERLKFSGMISTGAKSIYFLGDSFDPAMEHIVSPRLFDPGLVEGQFLSEAQKDGIVVGKLMAETLDLKVGDSATLMAQSLEGQVNSFDVVVSGIIDMPILELSRRLVYTHIKQAREIIAVDDSFTELAVKLKQPERLAEWITRYVAPAGAAGQLALAWWDLYPFVPKIEMVLRSVVAMVCLLLFLSAGIAILNIIYLTVEERTVELGTLMALGAKSRDIWALFCIEASVIGLLGGISGALLANATLLVLGFAGIPFKNPFGSGTIFVHPHMNVALTFGVAFIAIVISTVAAFLPATKGTRIDPVDAFRRIIT
jgi:putative ABC transport system permease protein